MAAMGCSGVLVEMEPPKKAAEWGGDWMYTFFHPGR
jgi:hypothetical protein